MEMRSFILHGDIFSMEVKIDKSDYRIGVQWKKPKNLMMRNGNKSTGEKDLSKDKIAEFLNTINANWNWNMDNYK